MRRSLLGVLLLLAACDKPSPPQPSAAEERVFQGPGFSLRLSLAPLANLLYHLDCLSGAVACTADAYRALWKLSPDDEAALGRWKSLRTQHTGTIRADAEAAAAPLLLPGAFIDRAERQRIAARRAQTLDEFEATTALLTDDADAHALRELAQRFQPRFTQYWQSRGQAAGAAIFADMSKLLGDQFLLDTLARVVRFDHSTAREYRLHLLVQPQADARFSGMRAYQIERDFEVEAPERAKALDVIDVVAHELCHAFLYQMPADAKRTLADAFVQSDDPYALVDYGLFDEALATSVGNGLVWRHFHPDQDFEQHTAQGLHSLYKPAAALAVALLPRLEALFASGPAPAVVRTLGEAARASYREHGPMPIDYLHGHVLIATPALEAAASKVRDAAFAGFPYLRKFEQLDGEAKYYLQQHPQLSAAVYLPSTAPLPELLSAFGMDYHRSSELQELVAKDRGLVYAMRTTAKTYVFLFVASDGASANELADKFVALREMRDGALVELPR